VASDERIEACLLYIKDVAIVSLRSFVEDGGARLTHLLAQLRGQGIATLTFPKVHPAEISKEDLAKFGFQSAGGHRVYATRAKSA
jgi:hypothetical protein